MKRYTVFSILFFFGGIVFFAIACYAFHRYQVFLELFDYYSISEKVYTSRPEISTVTFNFKFGIIKYTLLGIIAWTASIYFLVKSYKKDG